MIHSFLTFLGCFGGSFIGTAAMRYVLGRAELARENARLRAWIDNQARGPELGPHRSAPVFSIAAKLGAGPALTDPAAGGHPLRPLPPPATTVPSGGRKVEE